MEMAGAEGQIHCCNFLRSRECTTISSLVFPFSVRNLVSNGSINLQTGVNSLSGQELWDTVWLPGDILGWLKILPLPSQTPAMENAILTAIWSRSSLKNDRLDVSADPRLALSMNEFATRAVECHWVHHHPCSRDSCTIQDWLIWSRFSGRGKICPWS
jgi:hypothetical protein